MNDASWRVPPGAAHKRNARHLWLGTATPTDATEVSMTFQTPSHGAPPRFAELVEVQRQAGIVYAHHALAVGESDVFILTSIGLEFDRQPGGPTLDHLDGTVAVRGEDLAQGRGRPKSAILDFSMVADEQPFARGAATVTFVHGPVYERMRRRELDADPTPPAPEPDVPRTTDVISSTVATDPTDPILADHGGDHVSAMAMVCAIEASLRAERPGSLLEALRVDFTSYAELTPAPTLDYRLDPAGAFDGWITQAGRRKAVFSGRITV